MNGKMKKASKIQQKGAMHISGQRLIGGGFDRDRCIDEFVTLLGVLRT
jgi:hypothetical protein